LFGLALARVRRGEGEEADERVLDFAPVSVKGQLVIPLEVRKLFNIEQGDRVAFVKKGEELVIRKAQLVIAKPPT
jgi:AbrB family looped-hinge helix DNA binding protein